MSGHSLHPPTHTNFSNCLHYATDSSYLELRHCLHDSYKFFFFKKKRYHGDFNVAYEVLEDVEIPWITETTTTTTLCDGCTSTTTTTMTTSTTTSTATMTTTTTSTVTSITTTTETSTTSTTTPAPRANEYPLGVIQQIVGCPANSCGHKACSGELEFGYITAPALYKDKFHDKKTAFQDTFWIFAKDWRRKFRAWLL